jgi:chromosome segregation ATPase
MKNDENDENAETNGVVEKEPTDHSECEQKIKELNKAVESLKEELSEKEISHKKEIEKFESSRQDLENNSDEKYKALENKYKEELSAKEIELEEYKKGVEGQLEDKDTEIAEANRNYTDLEVLFDNIIKEKEKLNKLVNEKENRIKELSNDIETQLSEKDQSLTKVKDDLNKIIKDKDEELKALTENMTKQIEEARGSSAKEITDLETRLEELKVNTKKDSEAKDSQIDELISKQTELLEAKANNELRVKELTKKLEQLEKESAGYKTQGETVKSLQGIKQTFKQFFFTLLEEDIFIDEIEKAFKEENSLNFFEEVYKLSKLIQPKIIFKIYNSILNNDEALIQKISKFNLENFNPKAYTELKSLTQLKEIDEEPEYLFKLLHELCDYIDNLNASTNKLIATNNELTNQLKTVKENLDEAKKTDHQKYDLLTKQFAKLQQECKTNNDTHNVLKTTIETHEANIKSLNDDLKKAQDKYNKLNVLHGNLQKENHGLREKNEALIKEKDLYAVENLELNEKNNKYIEERQALADKLSALEKEKSELSVGLGELEKTKKLYQDSLESVKLKEIEIDQLRTSYSSLEEFIDGLKSTNEEAINTYKEKVLQLVADNEKLKGHLKLSEDKLSEIDLNVNNTKIEDLEKNILSLELENKNLKEQKDKMKKYSEEILFKVKNDLKDTEFLIDKRMISNILIKYFDKSANDKLKIALLDTLANFMGYNNDERKKIGLTPNNVVIPTTNSDNDKLKELSDQLYNFILND